MNPPAALAPSPKPALREVPFGVNAMRLTLGQWAAVAVIVLLALVLTPRIWKAVERFDTGPDYRIPYALSQDYWLYERWLDRNADAAKIMVVGDSVVWEDVRPDGTWSHFLNQEAGQTNRFVNLGMNGLFPLALEGLETYYGRGLRHKKVLLHFNLLWLTSPKADLQATKEEKINHSRLIPQFTPRIPCYRADANERLAAVVERNLGLVAWVNHIQQAYFESKSILSWTLQDDGADPPQYPNSYRNPLAAAEKFEVPAAPGDDPARGPASPRHVPWFKNSGSASQFEWVALETSLQWRAFQRLVGALRDRGNDLFIVLGPFNEHLIAEESRPAYRKLREGAAAWFAQNQVSHWAPEPLPSALYADASHPLTAGYEQLAKQAFQHAAFQAWLKGGTTAGP